MRAKAKANSRQSTTSPSAAVGDPRNQNADTYNLQAVPKSATYHVLQPIAGPNLHLIKPTRLSIYTNPNPFPPGVAFPLAFPSPGPEHRDDTLPDRGSAAVDVAGNHENLIKESREGAAAGATAAAGGMQSGPAIQLEVSSAARHQGASTAAAPEPDRTALLQVEASASAGSHAREEFIAVPEELADSQPDNSRLTGLDEHSHQLPINTGENILNGPIPPIPNNRKMPPLGDHNVEGWAAAQNYLYMADRIHQAFSLPPSNTLPLDLMQPQIYTNPYSSTNPMQYSATLQQINPVSPSHRLIPQLMMSHNPHVFYDPYPRGWFTLNPSPNAELHYTFSNPTPKVV